jgi:hypothetical protein
MKSYFKHILSVCATLALLASVSSCGDKADFLQSLSPAGGARVKFYHSAADAVGVDILIDDKKYSGVNTVAPAVPTPLTYTGSYPNIDYGMVTAGTIKVKVNTAVAPIATVLAADLPVEEGKYYSIFAYGVAPTYKALVVNDVLEASDKSKAYIRLVNLVSSNTATPTQYDLLYNGVQIASATFGATSGNFIPVDGILFNTTAQTIQLRVSGTTTIAASGTIQPYGGKFYTYIARGIVASTKTPPTLGLSVNL